MVDEEQELAAPQSVSELLERLDRLNDRFPKRMQQCSQYTRQNLHLIAVSTITELAAVSGVAPSVYMRFCKSLGFSGFSDMQALFKARHTELRPDYDERIAELHRNGEVGTSSLLAEFAEAGHKSLLSIGNTVTGDELERMAHAMSKARVIHLIGLRRSLAVVSNMAYLFDKLEVPASLHFGGGLVNSTRAMLDGDVLFAVAFTCFSQETLTFAEHAASQGITVFALTDKRNGPLESIAKETLIAHEEEVAGFRSLNAAITMTTALAVATKALRAQT